MEQDEREWLEKTILESERSRCISKILKTEHKNAINEGSVFFSDLFRLKLKVMKNSTDIEERSVIYKTQPHFAGKVREVKEKGLFKIEIKMYREVFNEMEKLFSSKERGSELLWPQFYGLKGHDEGFLMEDLSVLGYKMLDRRKELDFEHLKLCVKALAKFHAAGAVLLEKKLIEEESILYKKCLIFRDMKATENMMDGASRMLPILIQETWTDKWRKYADKMKNMKKTLAPRLQEALEHSNYSFITLNHGDCWTNNVLFKYDTSGALESVKLLDFQLTHINSPCLDLHYLFSSSMRLEIIHRKLDLLRIYHYELKRHLTLFDYKKKIPLYKELEDDFNKSKIFGSLITLILKPFYINPSCTELMEIYGKLEGVDKYHLVYLYEDEYYFKTLRHTLLTMEANRFI